MTVRNPSGARASRFPPHIVWPGIIISMIGLSVIVCVITVIAAVGDKSFAVEPSYYEKALAWDDSLRQQQANERLGWAISAAIGADDEGRQQLLATIVDADAEPIEGATVSAVVFHRARVAERQDLTFADLSGGRYGAPVAIAREGFWELRFTVRRGDVTFTHTVDQLVLR
jgi:nitrogen fixation protein FixH